MNITLIQTATFAKQWKAHALSDDDLRGLEALLRTNPLSGAVIKGGAGVRKIRFASSAAASGKSGGYRVIYFYVPRPSVAVALMIFAKSGKTNLTPDEVKILGTQAEVLRKSFGDQS